MGLEEFFNDLGPPIEDADEETFLVFSHDMPLARNLGFVDAHATSITLTLAGNSEVTINQSPTLLRSNLRSGTTGAVLWQVSPLMARWLAEPNNMFFTSNVLKLNSTVIELGCGISGVMALALASKIGTYVCTDQQYVLKALRQNIIENLAILSRPSSGTLRKTKKGRDAQVRGAEHLASDYDVSDSIKVLELDWEESSLQTLSGELGRAADRIDMVIACDCIYNSHLVKPLVQACVEICRLRADPPILCLVAQQTRSEDIFQEWLHAFMEEFVVWRIPDEVLDESLRADKGFTVHVGILKSGSVGKNQQDQE